MCFVSSSPYLQNIIWWWCYQITEGLNNGINGKRNARNKGVPNNAEIASSHEEHLEELWYIVCCVTLHCGMVHCRGCTLNFCSGKGTEIVAFVHPLIFCSGEKTPAFEISIFKITMQGRLRTRIVFEYWFILCMLHVNWRLLELCIIWHKED